MDENPLLPNENLSDSLLGKQIEEYEVLEDLGKGGTGTVYRVRHGKSGKDFALKVLSYEGFQDSVVLQRFLNEAKLLKRIQHPHIVEIYKIGTLSEGRPYFIMEYLEGLTLEAFMQKTKYLPEKDVAALMIPVCAALHAAHQNQIIHRDLKPENIFLSFQDGKRRIKVLDFGIAKLQGPHRLTAQTKRGLLLGTPQYMAPEQAQTPTDVDERSDLYSVGIILYELITGRLPFEAPSTLALLVKHQDEIPPPPSSFITNLSPRMDRLILHCLNKNPNDRIQNAKELAEELRQVIITHGNYQNTRPPSEDDLPTPLTRKQISASSLKESFLRGDISEEDDTETPHLIDVLQQIGQEAPEAYQGDEKNSRSMSTSREGLSKQLATKAKTKIPKPFATPYQSPKPPALKEPPSFAVSNLVKNKKDEDTNPEEESFQNDQETLPLSTFYEDILSKSEDEKETLADRKTRSILEKKHPVFQQLIDSSGEETIQLAHPSQKKVYSEQQDDESTSEVETLEALSKLKDFYFQKSKTIPPPNLPPLPAQSTPQVPEKEASSPKLLPKIPPKKNVFETKDNIEQKTSSSSAPVSPEEKAPDDENSPSKTTEEFSLDSIPSLLPLSSISGEENNAFPLENISRKTSKPSLAKPNPKEETPSKSRFFPGIFLGVLLSIAFGVVWFLFLSPRITYPIRSFQDIISIVYHQKPYRLLEIKTDPPDAEIMLWIDQQFYGRVPISSKIHVLEGSFVEIIAVAPGFASNQISLEVLEARKLTLVLRPE